MSLALRATNAVRARSRATDTTLVVIASMRMLLTKEERSHSDGREDDVARPEAKITEHDEIRRKNTRHTTPPGNGADYLGGALSPDSGIRERGTSATLDNGESLPSNRESEPEPSSVGIAQPSPTTDAQCYIQQELESSAALRGTNRTVLRSALDLISQLSRDVKATNDVLPHVGCGGTAMEGIHYPSIELLGWMLRDFRSGKIGFHASYLFKYLSTRTLERMGLALIKQDGDQETLLLYSICVDLRAAQFLNMTLLEETDGNIAQKLRVAAEQYRCSVGLALSRIRLITPPSVALLQAQLCGASIFRATGNSAACWTFTSAACKTCIDLELDASLEKEDEELYYCFVSCYILDKAFSMSLGRRPYFSRVGLISSEDPVWTPGCNTLNLMTVYLELARIQGVIASELHCNVCPETGLEQRYKVSLVANLLLQMDGLRKKVNTFDRTPSDFYGLYMDRELHALDFAFYSVLTAIRRFESLILGERTSIGRKCVEAARKTILSLRYLQESQSDATRGARLSFINWTLLFYPPTPFFVLFHNVVATSNRDDFNLIKTITEGLSCLASFNPSIENLKRIFSVFVGLSEQILNEDRRQGKRPRTLVSSRREGGNNIPGSRNAGRSGRGEGRENDATRKHTVQDSSEKQSTPPPWETGGFMSTFSLHDPPEDCATVGKSMTSPSQVQARATAPVMTEPTMDSLQVGEAETAQTRETQEIADYAANFSLPPDSVGYDTPFWELWGAESSADWFGDDLELLWPEYP